MKGTNKIIQLVPNLPPTVDGLGDYAFNLALEFSQKGTETIFISTGGEKINQFETHLIGFDGQDLINAVLKTKVNRLFLNYVPYSYQKRGVPFWLLQALTQLVKQHGIQLFIYFHELNASGKIYQSSFWLKPLQQLIYKQLQKLASFSFCSNQTIFNILEANLPNGRLLKIEIFSNIPEPITTIHWKERENTAVIFGSHPNRMAVYRYENEMNRLIQSLGITTIIDIGPGTVTENNLNLPIISKGKLSGSEVAQLLSTSKWGFINYNDILLEKSGIFAAYAAHGLAVINVNPQRYDLEKPLHNNFHYKIASTDEDNNLDGQLLSKNLYDWYQSHTLKIHAAKIHAVLEQYQ